MSKENEAAKEDILKEKHLNYDTYSSSLMKNRRLVKERLQQLTGAQFPQLYLYKRVKQLPQALQYITTNHNP